MNSKSVGYLLVGHGTRKPAGAAQLRTVFEQLEPLLPRGKSGYCFLELAEPTIEQGIEELASAGVKDLVVVPLLLFTAGHAIEDIPQAVNAAAAKHGIRVLAVTPSLGCDPAILRLSALRFRESVCQVPRGSHDCSACTVEIHEPGAQSVSAGGLLTACSPSHCSGKFCSQTAMVLVGRGSKSAAATSQMRQFAELRRNLTPVSWMQTCFLHGQIPDLDSALEALCKTEHPIAVIQPHLLFEGLLMDELRQRVAKLRVEMPERTWILASTLGTDRALAVAIAELVQNTLITARNQPSASTAP